MFADLPVNAIAEGCLSWDDAKVQEHIKHLDNCEWYECNCRFLYIVDLDSDELIWGPDNEMAQEMYDALQAGALEHRLEKGIEGLSYVHHILHRFTIEEGFYHA